MKNKRFNQQQRNTVSKEAAKVIEGAKGFDVPNIIPIPNRMIFRMRDQFQKGEDVVEEQIIKDNNLNVQDIEFGGVKGLLVESPNVKRDNGFIINIHGGGFIMGTSRDRNGLLAAVETNLPVYSVDYTLAPEATADVSLKEVESFYTKLVNSKKDEQFFIMGSSAGSTMAASTIVQAHQESLRLPSAAILFCPALDISGNGDSAVFNNKRDFMSAHLALRLARKYIGDNDPLSPKISPMYAKIGSWFPPTFMSSGTRDVMMSNVLRFTDKLKDANVPNYMVIKEGLWHGFTWEPKLKEAIDTRKEAWNFLDKYKI